MTNDDMALVRDYAVHQSEPAFEALGASEEAAKKRVNRALAFPTKRIFTSHCHGGLE